MSIDHHACLIKLSTVSVETALAIYGDTNNLESRLLSFETIGIDDVRRIIEIANLRPSTGEISLLIITAMGINFEAQQALLKVLEEPPVSTRFLFVLKDNFLPLPTLASRFFVLKTDNEKLEMTASFAHFLDQPYEQRLEEISKKMAKKDTSWIEEMRNGLKHYIENLRKTNQSTKILATYNLALGYLTMRGAANKMLLEELALTLPTDAQK